MITISSTAPVRENTFRQASAVAPLFIATTLVLPVEFWTACETLLTNIVLRQWRAEQARNAFRDGAETHAIHQGLRPRVGRR